jgi:hypothetical protein
VVFPSARAMFMQDLVAVNAETTPKVPPKVCICKPRRIDNFLNCHEQLHSWKTFVLVGSEIVSPLHIQQHLLDPEEVMGIYEINVVFDCMLLIGKCLTIDPQDNELVNLNP